MARNSGNLFGDWRDSGGVRHSGRTEAGGGHSAAKPVAARIAGESYNRKDRLAIGNRYGWSYDTQLKIEQFIASHQAEILAWSGQAGTAVAMMLQKLIWIVLVPILAIFFLRDGRQFSATLLHTFSESKQRRFLRLIMTDLDVMLAHFIRAQLILAGISLVVYSVVLTALRFPYALALGFAAGAMEFIPVVGPLVAALVIVFVGFLTTYPHLWALILFFAVWRGGAGLLRISASDGWDAKSAPSGGNRGCADGSRTRRSSGRVSFDPGRGNHPHCLGALAEILRGHCDSGSARRSQTLSKALRD
jgi:AI-2E family transporter